MNATAHATKFPKTLAATAFALAALAATPLAHAGLAPPQKRPDTRRHPEIIAILKHPPTIIAVRHPDILFVEMRKAGGDPN